MEGADDLSQYFSRAGKKAWFLILPHCLMSMSTSDVGVASFTNSKE